MKILKIINISLACLWFYQGLVPKLMFINAEEILIWQWFGLSYDYAKLLGQASGIAEMIFALLFIFVQSRYLHYLSILALVFFLLLVAIILPSSLIGGFNPVVMNVAMIQLSVVYLLLLKHETHPHSS